MEWVWPLLLAILMFLCIRFAEDLPKGSSYWHNKSVKFVLIDFGGVVATCYVFRFVIDGWLALNMRWKIGSWFEYGLLVIGIFILCLAEMFISWHMNDRMYGLSDIAVPLLVSIFVICLFYGYRRRVLMKLDNEKLKLTQEQMKAEQLQTELKFLRAQFHPHFLFNALNTVYFQIDENNPKPRHTLEILSDLLRYQIYNEGHPVDIRSEVEFLNQYISLCRMRCSDKLQFTFDMDEKVLGFMIQPMLFLPLVENAFKYVGGDYIIRISLTLMNNRVVFKIENSIPDTIPVKKNSGVGLENLRRRLSILYPDRHQLSTEKEAGTYFANLTFQP